MRLVVICSFILSLCIINSQAQDTKPIAFPGAEGGGMYATGGRGGKIIYVENLNDKGNGSLRKAIEQEGPRIIMFKVSGNIELAKPIYIKNPDCTIAGQSAPGDGICLKNYNFRIQTNNVIVRFIRVRPGDTFQEEQDAMSVNKVKNVIIDHCSTSWSTDETGSFYDNEDFTLQWCILSESFYKSVHHKGSHGYGGIWGGTNASFHHNLLSDHTNRNPRFQGSRYRREPENEKVDFRNNVIYNWGYNSAYGNEQGYCNIVNNYYKAGPATDAKAANRILQLTTEYYDAKVRPDTLRHGWFYIKGNVTAADTNATAHNWKYGVHANKAELAQKDEAKLDKPVVVTPIAEQSAEDAYKAVMQHAGASLRRDSVDMRIIDEASTGKERFGASYEGGKNGIIDSQTDVGSWPALQSLPAPTDTDADGMPDDWELAHKLDPKNAADGAVFGLSKLYTNVEAYLNTLTDELWK